MVQAPVSGIYSILKISGDSLFKPIIYTAQLGFYAYQGVFIFTGLLIKWQKAKDEAIKKMEQAKRAELTKALIQQEQEKPVVVYEPDTGTRKSSKVDFKPSESSSFTSPKRSHVKAVNLEHIEHQIEHEAAREYQRFVDKRMKEQIFRI